MKTIESLMHTILINKENNSFKIVFPEEDNCFRLFPSLSKYIERNKQVGILELTVDKMIIPLELYKQNILEQRFKLKSKALIKEGNVCTVYNLETDIYLPNNAYIARNLAKTEDGYISIAPCQIQIPAYSSIKFEKII